MKSKPKMKRKCNILSKYVHVYMASTGLLNLWVVYNVSSKRGKNHRIKKCSKHVSQSKHLYPNRLISFQKQNTDTYWLLYCRHCILNDNVWDSKKYFTEAYQLAFPKPLTRPFLLKYVKLLGFGNQASLPPLQAPWGVTYEWAAFVLPKCLPVVM